MTADWTLVQARNRRLKEGQIQRLTPQVHWAGTRGILGLMQSGDLQGLGPLGRTWARQGPPVRAEPPVERADESEAVRALRHVASVMDQLVRGALETGSEAEFAAYWQVNWRRFVDHFAGYRAFQQEIAEEGRGALGTDVGDLPRLLVAGVAERFGSDASNRVGSAIATFAETLDQLVHLVTFAPEDADQDADLSFRFLLSSAWFTMGVNALFLTVDERLQPVAEVRDAVIQAVSDGAVTAAAQVKAAMGLRKGAIDARFANLAADTALLRATQEGLDEADAGGWASPDDVMAAGRDDG